MYRFSEEEVRTAAQRAKSKTEMMQILRIKVSGGGYQTLDKWCRKYNIEPPDGFKVSQQNLNQHQFVAMSNDDWFINGVQRNGAGTRKRLISLGIPNQCSMSDCPSPEPQWLGKPLTLQVDHINGDRWDNRIENVRLLCPNCHTQTETYSFNGRRRARHYCICGKEIWKSSKLCKSCTNKKMAKSRNSWPEIDEVIRMVRLTNFSQAAKILGVSDNGIRKFLVRNGINLKTLEQRAVV